MDHLYQNLNLKMKKLFKIFMSVWSWLVMILIIPVLILDFVSPILFESAEFWQNRILLITLGLLILYPFLTTWSALHAKLARRENKLWWSFLFLLLPVLNLAGVLLMYFKFHQIEMDKVLALIVGFL